MLLQLCLGSIIIDCHLVVGLRFGAREKGILANQRDIVRIDFQLQLDFAAQGLCPFKAPRLIVD